MIGRIIALGRNTFREAVRDRILYSLLFFAIALILSAALMLKYIGERAASARIEAAIGKVLERKDCLTPDLGGRSSSAELTDAIIRAL